MIFERKSTGTWQVVPTCYRAPILKFHFEMLLFNLAHKKVVCYPKMDKKLSLNIFVEPATGRNVFFDYLTSKYEEKLPTNVFSTSVFLNFYNSLSFLPWNHHFVTFADCSSVPHLSSSFENSDYLFSRSCQVNFKVLCLEILCTYIKKICLYITRF